MNIMSRKWRGFRPSVAGRVALAIAVSALAAQAAVQVKTLGGGPNQSGNARNGSANGETLNYAKFNVPSGVAADTNGNLYVADKANNKVRKITQAGAASSLTSTFATGLRAPVGVAVDRSNFIYVVSQGDGKLRKYASNGELVKTVNGLVSPTALALGATGEVYVTELRGTVKRVGLDGTKTLIASGFSSPRGLAVLDNTRLVVSASGDNAIFTVERNPTGTNDIPPRLIAGGNGAGFNDGPGLSAQFNQPYGVAVAPNGQIVVADRKNHRVRVIDTHVTNSVVSTLFGVDKSHWAKTFPGWSDGDASTASAREPVGVIVDNNGTVFDTEVSWHLIRQATGGGLTATNGTGNTTNVVVINGTNYVVVGTNVISFGFEQIPGESVEATSDFVGAAGQKFYAPITMTIAPGQRVYSFQMSLSATGETGVVLDPSEAGFVSMVDRQLQEVSTNYFYNPPLVTTNIIGYIAIQPNYTFANASINLLGIGWIERFEQTNLYDTTIQHLFSYSIAQDRLFKADQGQVVIGAYRLPIPITATNGSSFRIALHNPSGTADGISQPVAFSVPTNGSLGAGAPNTIRRVTLGSRPYIVGDSTPFRWFNAGDFGDNKLASTDVSELFQTVLYDLNRAIEDSDLFDSMDSSDGSSGTVSMGNDVSINGVTQGDGILAVDDVWVTFRRSLDPTLKWFARYWSNGVRQAVEVPNTLTGGFGSPAPLAAAAPAKRLTRAKSVARPAASLTLSDSAATPNAVLQLPMRLGLEGADPLRVMMLNVTVEALDGSPAIVAPIQLQTAPTFRNPELSDSHGPNNYAAAWLDNTVVGLSGDSTLAILTVQVPANAGPGAAYRVHFNHFSGSPNGLAIFDSHTRDGLILLSDRSASTWNDGIADEWRLRYFGSIFAAESSPGADADGDGVINSAEYQNGTDPTDSLSH